MPSTIPSMTGSFRLVTTVNFDKYLLPFEPMFVMRQWLAGTTSITNEEDEWAINTDITGLTPEIKFKLGEEFYETSLSGRVCKSVVTQEGENKLVQAQKHDNGLISKILMEFTDTQMKMTLEAPGNIIAFRIYERL